MAAQTQHIYRTQVAGEGYQADCPRSDDHHGSASHFHSIQNKPYIRGFVIWIDVAASGNQMLPSACAVRLPDLLQFGRINLPKIVETIEMHANAIQFANSRPHLFIGLRQ